MRMKKPLQTAGVTLLATAILLLTSTLLFIVARALLPDRTGETHSYAAPDLPSEESAATELYPWDRMTTPWSDGEKFMSDKVLFNLLDPLLPERFSLHAVDWEEAEFLCDETQTLHGFRNVEVLVRSSAYVIVEDDGRGEAIADTGRLLPYRFSFAFQETQEGMEVCFMSLEPPPREESLPSAEEAGLVALTEWVKKRDLYLDSGSPFAVFLWRFVDVCAALESDYDSYSRAMLLYETGVCEINRKGPAVYCTFKGRDGVVTLLYNPVYQTVYGISIQIDR